tara:strand:- start:6364 stop:6573 length:210 start_codon:yes stop_codon:yes gene_type:complete
VKEMIVKLNQLVVDFGKVESLEWKELEEEKGQYSLRLHTTSGKMYTRQVSEKDLNTIKEQYAAQIEVVN